MIPIKDAITIFEQHKIEQLRNSDFLKFECDFETSGFSANKYIMDRIQEWLDISWGESSLGLFKSKEPLLLFLKKRYHRTDKEPIVSEGLSLYGKKVTYFNGIPQGSNEYEEIYKHNYYATTEEEIELDFETGECKAGKLKVLSSNKNEQLKKNPILTTLFENYDYKGIYSPSINYTVMGDIENNIITYMDICVDNEEFKKFLESEFSKKPPSKYSELINKTLDKFVNKVEEVFRLTIEKNIQLNKVLVHLTGDSPKINKEDSKTLNEFIHKHIKRQIKYNKILDKKIKIGKYKKK